MEPDTWLGMETGCSLNCIILRSPFPGGLDSKQSAMWETWVRLLGWKDPWRKEWLTSPVFLPGEFHGQRGLAGYSPWGLKESGRAERLTTTPPPFTDPQTLVFPGRLRQCQTFQQNLSSMRAGLKLNHFLPTSWGRETSWQVSFQNIWEHLA